jgi:hypothetical protein
MISAQRRDEDTTLALSCVIECPGAPRPKEGGSEVPGEIIDPSEVIKGIRRRANSSRLSAYVMIGAITIIGVATAYIFLLWSDSPALIITGNSNLAGAKIDVTAKGDWLAEITRAFVRIASVVMAVFLINILVSFARYGLRVANYLDSRADCLAITRGNAEQLAMLLPSVSVDLLDFTKTPMSPYDAYFDVVRGLLPGRGASVSRGNRSSEAIDEGASDPRPVRSVQKS